MPFFDWGVKDQIRRLRRSYKAAGYAIESITQHLLAVSFGTIAPGATSSPAPLSIGWQGDYVWLGNMIVPHLDYSASATNVPWFSTLIRIELLRTGRNLGRHQDTAGNANRGWIPPANIAGHARSPFLWPWPMILTQGDQIQLEAVHRGAANLNGFRFTLLGLKIVRERRAAA